MEIRRRKNCPVDCCGIQVNLLKICVIQLDMAIEEIMDLEEMLLPSLNPSRPRPNFDWNQSSAHVKSFKITIRTLQLDHSEKWWSFASWTVGLLMILVIPILRLIFFKTCRQQIESSACISTYCSRGWDSYIWCIFYIFEPIHEEIWHTRNPPP